MSERYSRLFALSGETYTPGAPVTLAAGALLKDNQTGKVLAQLKLRSISPKPIKAAKVQIIPMDTVGRPLGEPVDHAYLDLSVSRNVDFGQKSAILLPDAECRRFSARVTEVAFGDNTVWSSNGEWKPLPYARPLQEALPDVELYKQYRLTYGNQCRYLPSEHEDLWYCGCGALNRKEESTCHHCGLELFRLKTVDWAALDVQKNARVAAEQAEAKRLAEEQAKADAARRAEEARQQEIAAAKAKKKKKTAAICAVLAVAVCAAAYVVTQIILPAQAQKEAYAKAQELFDAGKYEEAIHAFTALGEYEDSAEMIAAATEAQYQQALSLLQTNTEASYTHAQSLFEQLGNYKDSKEMITECTYQRARLLYNNKQYKAAFELFETITTYKQSAKILQDYVPATISDLHQNPNEYNNLKVHISGFIGSTLEVTPFNRDPFYDIFLVKYSTEVSHIIGVGSLAERVVMDYWKTMLKDKPNHIGFCLEKDQYSQELEPGSAVTISGIFTYNPRYIDEEVRSYIDPHGYNLEVHSYTVE